MAAKLIPEALEAKIAAIETEWNAIKKSPLKQKTMWQRVDMDGSGKISFSELSTFIVSGGRRL